MSRKLFVWVCDNDKCCKHTDRPEISKWIQIKYNNIWYHFCSTKCHKLYLYSIDFENTIDNNEEK